MKLINAFIESFGKMLYVFCISIAILSLSVILFLWATEWLWPELHGSKKLGDGIYLFEFDGGPIIVKGNSISGNTCYGGEGIIPNMQFDSLCERVDKYEFDEKWIIAKTKNNHGEIKFYILNKAEYKRKALETYTDSISFARSCRNHNITLQILNK